MNMYVYTFVLVPVFSSLVHVLRSEISGSCGNTVFNFLKDH